MGLPIAMKMIVLNKRGSGRGSKKMAKLRFEILNEIIGG